MASGTMRLARKIVLPEIFPGDWFDQFAGRLPIYGASDAV
jgi:hypothetical protein